MAGVGVTIDGVLYDLLNKTTQRVILMGELSLTGLTIGGGPVYPAPTPPPSGGVPIHPIWGPPGFNPPGPGMPPGIGGGPIIPPQPIDPPPDQTPGGGTITKPPPPDGGWGYS